ncbi:RodZ domain-containing protein [Rheinheimera gaetbuli]
MTAETPTLTVGQQLQQAREQRGLSQQQVAVQLNLKPEVVNKLELGQLDGTLETYARGYVRAYARLMKLPEKELMAAYGEHCSEHSAAKPMRTFSNRAAHQATENRFMWLTYAIIALLLLLLFIWWWQSELNVPTDGLAQQTETPAATVVVAESGEAVAANNSLELAGASEANTEQMAAMLAQFTDVSPQSSEAAPKPAEPLLDQLEMRFSANCWVNVVDAQGNRVAYGTKQSGYVMQLQGKAPFEVTLGNPSVVQINFNQQAVDMSSLPGGRVAKFSIPESE